MGYLFHPNKARWSRNVVLQFAECQKNDNGQFLDAAASPLTRVIWLQSGEAVIYFITHKLVWDIAFIIAQWEALVATGKL